MNPLPVVQPPETYPGPSSDTGGAAGDTHGETGNPRSEAAQLSDSVKTAELEPLIIDALRTVFDPEIPVNIYELGLIYGIVVDASGAVTIRMTLTAPACPAAQYLPAEVKSKVAEIPGVSSVTVDVVWEPPWSRDRMSDAAKLQLGLY